MYTSGCMFTKVLCTHHMDEADMLGGCVHVYKRVYMCVHVGACECMFTIVLCTHHMDEAEMLGWYVHVWTCVYMWVHVSACLL